MALPQAIQAQVEQAEQLQKAVYEGQATPPVEAQPAPVEPQEAAPEPVSNVVELPKQAEPAKAEVPPKQDVAQDAAYWQKRFETVQGKLNAEMPELYRTLREKEQQLDALKKAQEQPPAAAEPTAKSLVTEKDVEDFGTDLVDFARRVAQEEVSRAVSAAMQDLRKEMGAVQEQVGKAVNTVVQSEADKFWARVNQLVPDWPTVDQDPEWVAFLDTTPEFSERTYRELASDAVLKGNAQKVASLVKTWRGETQTAMPTPQPVAHSPQTELQRQVAPSTSRSSNPAPQGERIWTQADYAAAYDVRNLQRFGEKKAAEMIAEADRAVAEGRVRW